MISHPRKVLFAPLSAFALALSIIPCAVASPTSTADELEAEGAALYDFRNDVESAFSALATELALIGGGFSPPGLEPIGNNLFAAGNELRLLNFSNAANAMEVEGAALYGFRNDVEDGFSALATEIALLGGGFSPPGLEPIGNNLFAAGNELGLLNFSDAANAMEAEGAALYGFRNDVENAFSALATEIALLGGGFSPPGLEPIGNNLFAAGEELRSVPEPGTLVLAFTGLAFLLVVCRGKRCKSFTLFQNSLRRLSG